MNVSIVSKQWHNLICNEPGNKNKIIPVFEVSRSSVKKLHDHYLNNKTKNNLQHYSHMRGKHVNASNYLTDDEMVKITKDVRLEGIISLDHSLQYHSTSVQSTGRYSKSLMANSLPFGPGFSLSLPFVLSKILPKLLELDLSNNTSLTYSTLRQYSMNCRLLEKRTYRNTTKYFKLSLSGSDICLFENLKEINMDNSNFREFNNTYADLINHQDIFLFHLCCENSSLERVSIRNMNYYHYPQQYDGNDEVHEEDDDYEDHEEHDYYEEYEEEKDNDDDDDQRLVFIQNL
jgi:hypothetical protein